MSGIYIHVPFCKKKCHYCDFYSITQQSYEEAFVSALLKEFELTSNPLGSIETIFIGGGTPSILSIKSIDRIINALHNRFDLSNITEFSIEANPGTLTKELLSYYFQSGINRISIGVQSLIDKELKFLQRIHTVDEAIENIVNARNIGFDNINADLIFSIPGQSYENLIYNIDTLVGSGITHISSYSLIYEEDTPLYSDLINNKIQRTDDGIESENYLSMIEHLNSIKFKQYEISNFSLEGYECIHNLNYWRRKEYLGFGPSAHSFINNKRYWNIADLKSYIELINDNKLPIIEEEFIDKAKTISEIIYLGLRAEGLNINLLSQYVDDTIIKIIIEYANKLEKEKYLYFKDNTIKLLPKGYSMADHLTVKFMEIAD